MDTEISQEGLEIGGDEAMEVFIHGAEGNPTLIPQVTVRSSGQTVAEDDRVQIREELAPVANPAGEGDAAPADNASGLKKIEFEIHDGHPTEEPEAPNGADADDA